MIKGIVNIKDKPTPHFDVYIGRENTWLGLPQSKWANPFIMVRRSERAEVIKKYREYIESNPDLIAALPELSGKVLGCYCKPIACHGDVLIELYNKYYAK